MPISRFLFFSSKRRSNEAFSLLRRFGPSKRIQSCNYVKSSRNGKGKPESNPLVNVDKQAPRSWGTYVIPGALLGFVGLAAIFHYNDERRAIPKAFVWLAFTTLPPVSSRQLAPVQVPLLLLMVLVMWQC